MNVHIGTYIRYSGPVEELKSLLEKIGNAVIEEGFGSDPDQDVAKSLITLENSAIYQWEDPLDFTRALIDRAIVVVVPTKEEEGSADGNTSD